MLSWIWRSSLVSMARMDRGNCIYVGRRSVSALLSSEAIASQYPYHIAILQLRIYALYSLNKRLLAWMVIFYLACSACSAWIVLAELTSISSIDSYDVFTSQFWFFSPLYLYKYQHRFSQPYPQSMAVPAYPNFSLVQSTDFGFPCCRMSLFSAFWYSSKDFGDLNQIVQYFAVAKDLSVFWSEILSSISLCACSICPFFIFPICSCHASFFFLLSLLVVHLRNWHFSPLLNICSIFATYLTCLLVWAFARVSPFAANFIYPFAFLRWQDDCQFMWFLF